MRLIASRQINSSNWWLAALQAVVAMIVGIIIMVWPKPTLAIFIYLFGVFVVVDGLIAIGLAFARRKTMMLRWPLFLIGLFAILVGIMIFVYPHATGLFLAYLVATWALLVGLYQITNVFFPRRSVAQRLVDAVAGVLSFALALYIYVNPGTGVLSLTWLIGAFCVVYGVLLLIRVMFPGQATSVSSEVPEA